MYSMPGANGKKPEVCMVEDLLCRPGRLGRPEHIVIIVRGLPGAGKTYVSKLLKVVFRFVVLQPN